MAEISNLKIKEYVFRCILYMYVKLRRWSVEINLYQRAYIRSGETASGAEYRMDEQL